MVLLVPIVNGLSQLQWLWFRDPKPLETVSYFQDARTGPMSGLLLLCKCSKSLLVWVGVSCSILQALFGAFAQQALSLPVRSIAVSNNATISRTLTYSPVPPNGISYDPSHEMEVDPGAEAAILTGLTGNNADPSDVKGTCVTGNCTFGLFASIGVCASAADVTSSIVSDCGEDAIFNFSSAFPLGICTHTVRHLVGDGLFNTISFSGTPITLYVGASASNISVGSNWQASNSSFNDVLIEFYVIYATELTTSIRNSTEPGITLPMAALKGTLNLCAHVYNSSMQSGVTNTTIQTQETHLPWEPTGVWNSTGRYGYTSTVSETSDKLVIESASLVGIRTRLSQSIFTGVAHMTASGLEDPETENSFSTPAAQQIAIHLYGNTTGLQVTDGVGGLAKWLENFATSLSNGYVLKEINPSCLFLSRIA